MPLCQREIGEGMFHVSRTFGFVIHSARVPGQLLKNLDSFIQIHSRSSGNVEYPPGNLACGRLACQQVGAYNVVYVGKVAALFSVAKDDAALAAEHLRNKFRQHSGIRRAWILARTENVEVAQRYGLK